MSTTRTIPSKGWTNFSRLTGVLSAVAAVASVATGHATLAIPFGILTVGAFGVTIGSSTPQTSTTAPVATASEVVAPPVVAGPAPAPATAPASTA